MPNQACRSVTDVGMGMNASAGSAATGILGGAGNRSPVAELPDAIDEGSRVRSAIGQGARASQQPGTCRWASSAPAVTLRLPKLSNRNGRKMSPKAARNANASSGNAAKTNRWLTCARHSAAQTIKSGLMLCIASMGADQACGFCLQPLRILYQTT